MEHMEETIARPRLLERRPPPQETCLPCMGHGRVKVAGIWRVCPACQATGRRAR